MRLIKLAFISAVILFLIATFIGLLLPSKVVVSRATDIIAPKDSIFNLVKNINQWKQWVNGMNNAGVVITSPTEADLAGTKVSITSVDNYTVSSTWAGKKGTVQKSVFRVIQDTTSNKAVAQWEFMQELKWYPWDRLSSMMNDKIMGEQLENNLASLKKLCEMPK
jgi:hypothetical protein